MMLHNKNIDWGIYIGRPWLHATKPTVMPAPQMQVHFHRLAFFATLPSLFLAEKFFAFSFFCICFSALLICSRKHSALFISHCSHMLGPRRRES